MRIRHKRGLVRIFYTMTICDLKKGERATVLRVETDELLKERLRMLNISTNRDVTVLKVSPFGKTFLLGAGSATVALRREIANAIRVFRA